MSRTSLPAISLLLSVGVFGCSQILGLGDYEEVKDIPADCNNGIKDGAESDVDCGAGCSLCADGSACNLGADCASSSCSNGTCQSPTCSDGALNGTETGIDCGGGACPPCGGGPSCTQASDCTSGICLNQQCQVLALWTKQFGDSANQGRTRLRATQAGDALFSGHYYGAIDLGGGPLTTCSGPFPDPMDQTTYCGGAFFLGTIAQTGDHIFSKTVVDESDLGGINFDMAVDSNPSGDVYMAAYGWITKYFDFGTPLPDPASCAPTCYEDIAVVKFDKTGAHQWSKRFGASDDQEVHDIAAHATGLVLTGNFVTSLNLGGATQTSAGSTDVFVGKLDPNGTNLWTKRFGDGVEQYGDSVRVDTTGNVVIAGHYKGAMNFGDGNMTSAGDFDLYLAKFSPSGNLLWRRRFGDAAAQTQMQIALDGAGNVYLAGPLAGSLVFDGTMLTGTSSKDIFVVKYSANADLVWAQKFGPADAEPKGISFKAMAVDTSGNVLLTGVIEGPVDFGGGLLLADKPFLVKLDTAGKQAWSTNAAGGQSITTLGTDRLYLAGSFVGDLNLDGKILTSKGAGDAFLALLANP